MVGWHHRLNGHGFEETPEVGDGQGGLACAAVHGVTKSQTRLSDGTELYTISPRPLAAGSAAYVALPGSL